MIEGGYQSDELHALAELGYALIREGRLDDARAVWEGLSLVVPADEAPYRALTVIAIREERWQDAVALATAALGRKPSAAPLLLRAEALFRTGRYADASRDLAQILEVRVDERDEAGQAVRRRAAVMHARLRRLG